jgi:hypothetical protein
MLHLPLPPLLLVLVLLLLLLLLLNRWGAGDLTVV